MSSEEMFLGNGILLSGFIRRSLPTSLLLRVGIMERVFARLGLRRGLVTVKYFVKLSILERDWDVAS